MEDNLKELKQEYKEKKKEINSFSEYCKLKKDYKEMKGLIKGSNKLLKDAEREQNKWDKTWDKFDEEYKKIGEPPKNEINVTKELANQKEMPKFNNNNIDNIKDFDNLIEKIDKKISELDKEKNQMPVTSANDNENIIEDINKKNEIFIRELMNKDSFMLDWYAGAVVPKNHPRYYDGRIEVSIRKAFGSSYGIINFGKDEFQISDELVSNLYNYIETNIDKLIKISLNQNTEMYEGGRDVLRIKYKSIYISINGVNASSEEEKNEIYKIKDNIKNIILSSSSLEEKNEINSETIDLIVKEIAGITDIDKINLLSKLVKKIVELPANTETTIAELMQLNQVMVNPLTQGEIFNLLMEICKKLNIDIEINNDEFGGLGYHYKFKKISDLNEKNYSQDKLKELFYRTMNENELNKLNELGMSEEINRLNTPTFQVKYFENIGYLFLGDGYIIQSDGLEQQRFFYTIVETPEQAKREIINRIK